jgi:hypothetical protein
MRRARGAFGGVRIAQQARCLLMRLIRLALVLVSLVVVLVACAAENSPQTTIPSSSPATCTDTECGPVPPVAPSACPSDQNITTPCERINGKCGRHVVCQPKTTP